MQQHQLEMLETEALTFVPSRFADVASGYHASAIA